MVSIRPVSEDDKTELHNLTRNNVERLLDFFPITIEKTETLEKTAGAIQLYKMLESQKELHVMVVQREGENQLLGMVFLKNFDHKVNKCEIAYFIDKSEEGKNLTTEAVLLALDMAFNQLNLNKIYCRVATDNAGSNKIAIKTGFELEGVLKQEYRIHNGKLIDLNYYGLLKENYN